MHARCERDYLYLIVCVCEVPPVVFFLLLFSYPARYDIVRTKETTVSTVFCETRSRNNNVTYICAYSTAVSPPKKDVPRASSPRGVAATTYKLYRYRAQTRRSASRYYRPYCTNRAAGLPVVAQQTNAVCEEIDCV